MSETNGPNRSAALTAALLAIFAVLVCVRMPQIVIKGRFWAEEGSIFFSNAWEMPPWQALFASIGGYLNLVANGSTLLAKTVLPLRLAPYVTITVALVCQLLPPLLLLTARDVWLQRPAVRIAALFLLLLVPGCEEIWLETICSQFELTLCCCLILTLDNGREGAEQLKRALLFLAPLCGPLPISLIPLFLLRTCIERTRPRLLQAVFLLAGAATQFLLFMHTVPHRAYTLDLAVLLCTITVRHIVMPFLGMGQADAIASSLRTVLAARHFPLVAATLPLVFVALFAAALRWRPMRPAVWLLLAGALVLLATNFGAVGAAATLIEAHAGQRYTFVPQCMVVLSFLIMAAARINLVSVVGWIAVMWLLAVGAYEYIHPWAFISHGPAWRKEVAIWRTNSSHAIREWPYGWLVTLATKPASPR